jgi:hypothetical protein
MSRAVNGLDLKRKIAEKGRPAGGPLGCMR